MATKKASMNTTTKKTATPPTPPATRKTTRTHTEAPMIIRNTPMIVTHHPSPDYDEIAQRAFSMFERRGYAHGHDVEDWLQAERELRQGL